MTKNQKYALNLAVDWGFPIDDAELVLTKEVTETNPLKVTRAFEAASHKRILALTGKVGVGKTVAAAWWATRPLLAYAERMDMEFRPVEPSMALCLFVTGHELSRWNHFDRDAMDEILDVKRLVIDDLGPENMDRRQFVISMLDEVIAHRVRNRRLTIITSNLNDEEFSDRYQERVVDRIIGSGNFLYLDGDSLRGAL